MELGSFPNAQSSTNYEYFLLFVPIQLQSSGENSFVMNYCSRRSGIGWQADER